MTFDLGNIGRELRISDLYTSNVFFIKVMVSF